MRRRKDNKSLTVVLYFFLLRDAPRSPSVLIGSGERPCAGRADVNRAPRSSAAGTNIHTSLLPFFHPPSFFLLHIYLICARDLQHLLFCGSFFPHIRSCADVALRFCCYQVSFLWPPLHRILFLFAHAEGSAQFALALAVHTSTTNICAYLLRGNTALRKLSALINLQSH